MEEKVIEKIFAYGVHVGCIKTLTELGLIEENISAKQAYAKYGERQVKDWRSKKWITGYPSGNRKRATYYFKRSELETASRMIDGINLVSENRIKSIQQSLSNYSNYENGKNRKNGAAKLQGN